MSLVSVADVYKTGLEPLPGFVNLGLPPFGAYGVLGALRLSWVLRQIRRSKLNGAKEPSGTFFHDLCMTLIVVFGGEALAAPLLGAPASFMRGPEVILLFVATHIIATLTPASLLPKFTLEWELVLSILDAATRSTLVCGDVAGLVKSSTYPDVRDSPMAVLITSVLLGNAGFFVINLFNMLSPQAPSWSVVTPPEIAHPYGFTTVDLWIAPVMSALYATCTGLQPFWRELGIRAGLQTIQHTKDGQAQVVFAGLGEERARALCFLIMLVLFTGRAIKNFDSALLSSPKVEKVQSGEAVVKVKTTSKELITNAVEDLSEKVGLSHATDEEELGLEEPTDVDSEKSKSKGKRKPRSTRSQSSTPINNVPSTLIPSPVKTRSSSRRVAKETTA